ncbi:NAD(P)-binding protein, partial [Kitasatospora sp. NPDC050463]|uniref:FAD-dependent oxidoreductase n=1 Tax=Kitasatospora sp. NPDC050463 TaxID=3155786 RepID=UPI0033CD7F63
MSNSRSREHPDSPVVILGGGPCGLACAYELQRLGHRDWLLLEAAPGVGGLGSSVVDEAGFTWDLGGHVVFSKWLAPEVLRGLITLPGRRRILPGDRRCAGRA